MEDTTKLNTSKLGTKEYWDDFYSLEKQNFEENPEDTGECWFADNDAEEKTVEFLLDNLGEYNIKEDSSMIDLGTGNGHLLFTLLEEGFKGEMIGVDYSEKSVEFAAEILKTKYSQNDNVTFATADIFNEQWAPGKFDVVLDKGTLDAIALSGIKFENNETVVDVYPKVIEKILGENSILLITSCNFTEEELIKIIETETLKKWKSVNYPIFEFGGVKGTTICSVAFLKSSAK